MDKQAQKKLNRRKAYEKQRNTQANKGKPKFRLDIRMNDKMTYGVMGFKDMDAVTRYVEGAEEMRRKGNVELVEGFVVDLKTGKQVAHVEPFKPKVLLSKMDAPAKVIGCVG